MKKYLKIEKVVFIILAFLIFLLPLILKFTPLNYELNGYEYEEVLEDLNFSNLKNHTFQNSLDAYVNQNLPAKSFFITTRNQFLYDNFNISPHESISFAKDKNLISKEVLDYYFYGKYEVDEDYINDLVFKLDRLNNILRENDKEMVIVITPTKARYLQKEDLPFSDQILNKYNSNKSDLPYNMLIEKMKNTDLVYFDSIDYIEKNKDYYLNDKYPLFYNSGHHWSYYKGQHVGLAMTEFFNKNTKQKFPRMKIIASESNAAVYPDDDLLRILNLNKKPTYTYMNTELKYDDLDSSFPNIIIRGGSFLGELMFPFITYGRTNNVLHIENKHYFDEHYMHDDDFETYDDEVLNLKENIKNMDLLILEINEVNVYNATFGFLDYMLSHSDYIVNKNN